jgi:exosortase A-associated hydrolase 1
MQNYDEKGLIFNCGEDRLVGVATLPEAPATTGVLILVGGPQYRAGSHRQFTLLARSLGEAGFASLRFDFSGMGDSEGDKHEFSHTQDNLSAAIDAFLDAAPGVSRIVLWGLCDAASSAMMYAHLYPQVVGMVLLNPWVHSGEYAPDVKMAHFYRPFLADSNKWRTMLSGKNRIIPTLRELGRDTLALADKRFSSSSDQPFIQQMLDGLMRFQHGVLFVLSADDLTAREFSSLVASNSQWLQATSGPSVDTRTVNAADHTFSKASWKEEVSQLTIDWVSQR